MSQKLAWFPFFPADWLSSDDVELMTIAEEGAYHRLLCRAWMEPDCGLPDDDAILAKLSRLGRQWKKSGPKLRLKFTAREGRLYNERLLTIHIEQQARSKKASESAKRRVNSNANAERTRDTNTTSQQGECSARASVSVSVSESVSQTTNDVPPEPDEKQLMRAGLVGYVRRADGSSALPPPDDAIVVKCLLAGDGATAGEIIQVLKFLHQNGQSPGESGGPKSWAWFPVVIARRFAKAKGAVA